ncbi:MAG: hypothetical protein GY705_06445, partial [Bacteroidetes bacterium]|nr:hypothetical protein [Bacteroidota bacterium]
MKDSRKIMMRLLQIACIALFIGRGWQHLASSTPFRVFFWNERLMSPLVRWFTAMQWSEYVTNPRVDEFINTFSVGMGIFY